MNMLLARHVLGRSTSNRYMACELPHLLPPRDPPMNLLAVLDAPPTDFVAFLAERCGLSPEDAEHRLERWFGEYHASSYKQAPNASVGSGSPASP